MVKIIDINKLKEGDVLADPIYNALGHILLPANAIITANSQKLLKTLNISNVTIKQNEDDNQNEKLPDEVIENTLKIISETIGWTPKNDYEFELLKMAAIHKIKSEPI